jgi:Tfp pilus assembly protein PilF
MMTTKAMERNTLAILFLIALLCTPWGVSSQAPYYHGDPDKSFQIARTLAYDGSRSEARDTLNNILSAYPAYSDVRNLLAKTYSWDGNFDEARRHFNRITSVDRENKEVWIATIKNEVYAENYPTALGLANKALLYIVNDADLLTLRAKIEDRIIQEQKAPLESEKEKDITTENVLYKHSVGVFSSVDVFDVIYDPMLYSGVEYIRETSFGKIIPRINYSNRFDINGVQYEIDLYPKFSKKFYGYFNYGYSTSDIYPNHRAGAELYANLPKGFEASLGMRYLTNLPEGFDPSLGLGYLNSEARNTAIYTGSVGWYKGNYYMSLRSYMTPASNNTSGIAGLLTARKYLKDTKNYLGVTLGMGFTPELRQFITNNVLVAESLLYAESQQLNLEYQFSTNNSSSLYKANLGLTRQELVFESNSFFWAVSAGFRYQVRF